MRRRSWVLVSIVFVTFFVGVRALSQWTPLAVVNDPLVRMPGTQPGQGVALEAPNRCLNCHAGYGQDVEPGFNWQGSMMAQAARDPIFWACMTVAAQDAIWAVGNPNATDLCLRCHFPEGWLAGRSDPTNASLMTGSDYDGLHCDFCHRMWDPFAKATYEGTRESSDWAGYWDEHNNTGPGSGTLAQNEAATTYAEDLNVLQPDVKLFSTGDFFVNNVPAYATYTESTSGQYFVSGNADKRASFADAEANHRMLYSRYHKSRYFCATCHDVSNPVLATVAPTLPDQSGGTDLITEQYPAGQFYHVERTFSEFSSSAYGQPGGAATNSQFQAQGASTIPWAATCQDCHMRDVRGVACNKKAAPLRPDESTEHPNSGVPMHDMTGGNVWTTHILGSLDRAGPIYDPRNAEILEQGPAVLTLDLAAGQSPTMAGAALKAGSDRARVQLQLAGTIEDLSYDRATGLVAFRVLNNTGHKLISGFPEGRRMFVNIKAYAGEQLLREVNPYDHVDAQGDGAGTLKGLPRSPNSPPLGPNEAYVDELVYEVHPSSTLTGEQETFHFVLATGRYKDNRIPPKGFDLAQATPRLCEPVWHGASAPDYFSAEEYAGGYDAVQLTLVPGADRIEVALYYQGTSREYIEFLRNEINATVRTLPAEAYVIQSDPFFAQLRAWGDAMWDLWFHNHGLDGSQTYVDGIVPLEMARAELVLPMVTGRWVFYNNSSFDGNDAAANAGDDGAVAPDKSPLFVGQTATFANYTSYSRGVNGIMVDLVNAPAEPTLADFVFKVGNDSVPSAWADAPTPVSLTVRSGAGAGGGDRVTIIWADGAVTGQWLRVEVLATSSTGLAGPDVFHFGNAVGETGDSAMQAHVNASDEVGARNNPHDFSDPAPITDRYDFNRDQLVNATDEVTCRNNPTHFLTALRLISPP